VVQEVEANVQRLDRVRGGLDGIDRRLGGLDRRLNQHDQRFDRLDQRSEDIARHLGVPPRSGSARSARSSAHSRQLLE